MTLLMILQAEKLDKFNYINNCLIFPLYFHLFAFNPWTAETKRAAILEKQLDI